MRYILFFLRYSTHPLQLLLHFICYLTPEEIVKASEITFEGGAEYVKTSTGFGPSRTVYKLTYSLGSATVEAVQAMSSVAKRFNGKVKAAGGVRSFADAIAMIGAGAYPQIDDYVDV